MSSLDELVTVLVPTSPIPRHPDTGLAEECLGAIRSYFPAARVIIMADGVRPAVTHRAEQYKGYLKALSAKVNALELGHTELLIFEEFQHQTRMTRRALQDVRTPLVLFVEHDAILRTEPKIHFDAIASVLLADYGYNMVRLYQWEHAPWHEHEYLMRGEEGLPTLVDPAAEERWVKTVQYSQWPLMARTEYHRKVVDMIDPHRYTMIEPAVYVRIANEPWEQNKIVIYAPPDNAHTFFHKDGRADQVTGRKDPADW